MKKIVKITLAAFVISLLFFNLNYTLEKEVTSNKVTLNMVKLTALAQSEYNQHACTQLHNCLPISGAICSWCGTYWCYTMQPAMQTGPYGYCDIMP